MRIAVSAGHSPDKPGATFGAAVEHTVAVEWAKAILGNLGAAGLEVPTGSLTSKIEFVNFAVPDLALEVHFNSDPEHKGHGCETLYEPGSERGHDAALVVQRTLASYCQPDRGVKAGWYRMDAPGIKDYPSDVEGDETPDAFLKRTICTALIIEPLFIHELGRINSLRDQTCRAVARALLRYFGVPNDSGTLPA